MCKKTYPLVVAMEGTPRYNLTKGVPFKKALNRLEITLLVLFCPLFLTFSSSV